MPKRVILSQKEIDTCIANLDLKPVLESRVRQVRWLYNNNNKCLRVYNEKLVVLMVHRLQERIYQLEQELKHTKETNGK